MATPMRYMGEDWMKKLAAALLASALLPALNAGPVFAYHCPILVTQCRALVEELEQRADTNEKKLAKAKQGCEEALRLHEAGKHAASIAKAGQAITMTGKAIKESGGSSGSSGGGM